MYIITNLFTGERKALEKAKEKLMESCPEIPEQRKYTEIAEKTDFLYFYLTECSEKIDPAKWLSLLDGTSVTLYWSAEDTQSKTLYWSECDEIDLLPNTKDGFVTKVCDKRGNVLPQGKRESLMFEYANLDPFIKWLNFKLRNDGMYEVTEKNVFPFLQELELQFHSRKHSVSFFVLPAFATKSGEYEAYKYKFGTVNGKDGIIL